MIISPLKTMVRTKELTKIFKSLKKHNTNNNNNNNNNNNYNKTLKPSITSPIKPTTKSLKIKTELPSTSSSTSSCCNKLKKQWAVYLILSTNFPIKTYVGSTCNFSRRLKQHNGELSGGAKATQAGKPWVCGCLIHGFKDQSEACVFESKWKSISKKQPRKRKITEEGKQPVDGSLLLLQHRQAALNRVKCLIDCTHLEIDWQLSPS